MSAEIVYANWGALPFFGNWDEESHERSIQALYR